MMLYIPVALIGLWLDPPLYFWIAYSLCFLVDIAWL